MGISVAALLWFMIGSLSLIDPLYPPNAVRGGTVVAELNVAAGRERGMTILSGEEPFVGACRTSLKTWRTDSDVDSNELVIVHFRQPYLYNMGDPKQEIGPAKPGKFLPYPISIVPPSYPADALGEGSVVLRLEISLEGQVTDVQVVKPLGILTDSSIDAARKWKFKSAVDAQGRAIASHAYAVLVYRSPIL
jgi:TonB family protein